METRNDHGAVKYEKKDRTDCGNYCRIALVAHAGKALLKVIAGRLRDYCECDDRTPDEQCGFRPQRSMVATMFMARRLWKLSRKKGTPLYLCYIDVTKVYESVDQTFLRAVLALFGVRPKMLAVINRFHDGMQVRVQLDLGECLAKFDVGQGLWQGCVHAPLLFNVFFTAVPRVAENRFLADAAIMAKRGAAPANEREGEEKGQATSGQNKRAEGGEGGRGTVVVGYAVR